LSTDGVYDFLSHRKVDSALRSLRGKTLLEMADGLVNWTLLEASRESELTLEELKNLPAGNTVKMSFIFIVAGPYR